jgi:hypothetical protein
MCSISDFATKQIVHAQEDTIRKAMEKARDGRELG